MPSKTRHNNGIDKGWSFGSGPFVLQFKPQHERNEAMTSSNSTVRVLLRTPRSCYATFEGARAAARRMLRKGDNVVRRNGTDYTWTMDNVDARPGGGFWGAGWVCRTRYYSCIKAVYNP